MRIGQTSGNKNERPIDSEIWRKIDASVYIVRRTLLIPAEIIGVNGGVMMGSLARTIDHWNNGIIAGYNYSAVNMVTGVGARAGAAKHLAPMACR